MGIISYVCSRLKHRWSHEVTWPTECQHWVYKLISETQGLSLPPWVSPPDPTPRPGYRTSKMIYINVKFCSTVRQRYFYPWQKWWWHFGFGILERESQIHIFNSSRVLVTVHGYNLTSFTVSQEWLRLTMTAKMCRLTDQPNCPSGPAAFPSPASAMLLCFFPSAQLPCLLPFWLTPGVLLPHLILGSSLLWVSVSFQRFGLQPSIWLKR